MSVGARVPDRVTRTAARPARACAGAAAARGAARIPPRAWRQPTLAMLRPDVAAPTVRHPRQPGRRQSTGSRTLLLEQLVRPGERPRAEESAARRERGRVRRLDDGGVAEQRPQVRGIPPPQDRDERRAAGDERADRVLGDLLPAPAAMGSGAPGAHGEHAVQQHDALSLHAREVAVRGRRDAEVVVRARGRCSRGSAAAAARAGRPRTRARSDARASGYGS